MISTWLWSHLPGNAWVKTLILLIAFVGLVAVLFEWVFPWLEPYLGIQEQTVGQGG
ncbi:hypothetical protein [Demequina zhanjiangensis]|uniref:AI-2E family transporter n=1 Tax=Demequina zhanjiangensis TaxID=3051659 RepID=A0ABT8G0C0_9MICO|nr:hypothetical protein [Demequina sp. SYSU T00b26]MDN4472404.1 hypothetical protein [Demequina sp. SYSU T00b26]